MKAVKCDICGKILDANKEQVFFEIHRLYKINPFVDERVDEVENDICYDCYNKLIATPINQNNWENNMVPNEALENVIDKGG